MLKEQILSVPLSQAFSVSGVHYLSVSEHTVKIIETNYSETESASVDRTNYPLHRDSAVLKENGISLQPYQRLHDFFRLSEGILARRNFRPREFPSKEFPGSVQRRRREKLFHCCQKE